MKHGETTDMVTIPNYSAVGVTDNRVTWGNPINKTTYEFSFKEDPDQLAYSSSNLI